MKKHQQHGVVPLGDRGLDDHKGIDDMAVEEHAGVLAWIVPCTMPVPFADTLSAGGDIGDAFPDVGGDDDDDDDEEKEGMLDIACNAVFFTLVLLPGFVIEEEFAGMIEGLRRGDDIFPEEDAVRVVNGFPRTWFEPLFPGSPNTVFTAVLTFVMIKTTSCMTDVWHGLIQCRLACMIHMHFRCV